VNAAENFDERGFARAVLAHERMHLAASQVKLRAVQRNRAAETLGYAGEREQRRSGGGETHFLEDAD